MKKLFLHHIKNSILLCLSAALFHSCKTGSHLKMFELLNDSETNITFANNIHNDTNLNILQYNYFYNGGGLAAADFNNDGLTDLYFTGNQVSSKLYLNKGNFKFEDITEHAGVATKNWATGIAVADINGDGLQDMYVSFAGYADTIKRKHQLFINKGIGKDGVPVFKDEAITYHLADTSYTTQSVFVDYDKDGDVDLVLINHYQDNRNPNYPKAKDTTGTMPGCVKLYRNDHNIFTEVAVMAGIKEEGYSLGVSISDINLDGWPDIYISKDFIFDDALYINNKNGTFTQSIKEYIQHTSQFAMGCDVADFNNDLYPDIVTADMLPFDNRRQKLMNIAVNNDRFNYALSLGYTPQYSRNMLQLNNGPGPKGAYSFSEIGQLAGVYKTDWSWAPLLADFDNDGWKDLFISNGIPRDITNNDFVAYRGELINAGVADFETTKNKLLEQIEKLQPVSLQNFIYQNNKDLTFTDRRNDWGLDDKGFSNAAVYVDLDNDGDLDLVTSNINGKASVYKNNGDKINGNNYLRLSLRGQYSSGAKIIIDCKGKKQLLEHNPCHGFQSSQDPVEHFGLGEDKLIDTLTIVWLDGKQQRLMNVKANQLLVLDYKNAAIPFATAYSINNPNPIFTDITLTAGFNFKHEEDPFEDFNYEPLLPHRFSACGPYICVADVNTDGLEDCWIGGADNRHGKIFFQQKNGSFISKNLPDTTHEDMGGLLLDADGDKDPDLYVVSGGNEYIANTKNYQDRLYFNDGKGNFTKDTAALPKEYVSGSVVTACDFDRDGDLDLFVGGRVVPGSYSYTPESFLLQNNGKGKFTNITGAAGAGLKNIGMVTAALWTDFDNDGWVDLILTGEWMPVAIFKNEQGILRQLHKNPLLDEATGWWNCLQPGDFDNDGDIDYVVGNLGLNNKFNVSLKAPLMVYAKDFDGNGYVESILSYYLNGLQYTLAGRDQVASVLPSVKKKFDTYTKFADAKFDEIFTPADLKNSVVHDVTTFGSVYIENKGAGIFKMHPLPMQAQFSTVRTMQAGDFNGDGNLDVLLAGNDYGADFMIGRYDAGRGLLLTGNGKGGFYPLSENASGLAFSGQVTSSAFINIKGQRCLLAAINSGYLQVYRLNIKY